MAYDLCSCGRKKNYKAPRCRECSYDLVGPPRESISDAEVAWVAGILEGEGCWSRKSGEIRWWVAVRMTDRDVIDRLQQVTGIGRITIDRGREENKMAWAWQVAAKRHREWLSIKVWPWMGDRRRARITELWPEVVVHVPQAFSGDVPAFQAG